MKKSRDEEHDPSRRKFLKGVGIAGAGATIADHLWQENAESKEEQSPSQAVSGATKITLQVNGQSRNVEVEPRTTLLNALRNHLEPAVTGPKLVCDVGTCGACTVLLDDAVVLQLGQRRRRAEQLAVALRHEGVDVEPAEPRCDQIRIGRPLELDRNVGFQPADVGLFHRAAQVDGDLAISLLEIDQPRQDPEIARSLGDRDPYRSRTRS